MISSSSPRTHLLLRALAQVSVMVGGGSVLWVSLLAGMQLVSAQPWNWALGADLAFKGMIIGLIGINLGLRLLIAPAIADRGPDEGLSSKSSIPALALVVSSIPWMFEAVRAGDPWTASDGINALMLVAAACSILLLLRSDPALGKGLPSDLHDASARLRRIVNSLLLSAAVLIPFMTWSGAMGDSGRSVEAIVSLVLPVLVATDLALLVRLRWRDRPDGVSASTRTWLEEHEATLPSSRYRRLLAFSHGLPLLTYAAYVPAGRLLGDLFASYGDQLEGMEVRPGDLDRGAVALILRENALALPVIALGLLAFFSPIFIIVGAIRLEREESGARYALLSESRATAAETPTGTPTRV